MKIQIFIILLTLTVVGVAHSQSIVYDVLMSNPDWPEVHDTVYPIDKSFEECDSTWVTNQEWGACLNSHIALWNTYIKETYDTLMQVLDSTGQSLLKHSQKNWENSLESEDAFSNYIMDVGGYYFGRDDDFKRFYSDLYEVRSRALELKGCLWVVRMAKKTNK